MNVKIFFFVKFEFSVCDDNDRIRVRVIATMSMLLVMMLVFMSGSMSCVMKPSRRHSDSELSQLSDELVSYWR